MDTLEVATPYYKGSQKTTPPKADHKHEYMKVFTRNRIIRADATITNEKYTFTMPAECIDCGHVNPHATATLVYVEPREFKRLQEEKRKKS